MSMIPSEGEATVAADDIGQLRAELSLATARAAQLEGALLALAVSAEGNGGDPRYAEAAHAQAARAAFYVVPDAEAEADQEAEL